jgi:hypothetical protein
MIQIPSYLAYILAGGVAVLILDKVFRFIKWIVNRINETRKEAKEEVKSELKNPLQTDPTATFSEFFPGLARIEGKVDKLYEGINGVALECVAMKTKLEFLSRQVEEENGAIKENQNRMADLYSAFNKQVALCALKFLEFENEIERKRETRKRG